MKNTFKNITLLLSVILPIGVIGVRRNKNNVQYEKLLKSVSTGTANTGDSSVDIEKLDFWDTSYWTKNASAVKLATTDAIAHAKTIYDALHGWLTSINTDEDAIYGVFSKLTNKGQVSYIADQYLSKYKLNMKRDILDKLDPDEIDKLYTIISKLS